jgi:diguanylate cyclase (GGDEF)-like protein
MPQVSVAVLPVEKPAFAASGANREQERLLALERLDILDTRAEDTFDRITRLTKRLFDVPVALVTFIDAHRQWYKSGVGTNVTEVPRNDSFCRYVVDEDRPLVVSDATQNETFAHNPYVVGDPHVRFYAGVPLQTRDGHSVGTLCIFDDKPRDFSDTDVELLTDLAKIASDQLELRVTASIDPLTGAMSRRLFKEELIRETALALRHHDDLSLIAIDLDHFKSANDTHGHVVGDQLLRQAADVCRTQLRDTDLLGRIGGEEFAALVLGAGPAGALEVAERIRRKIAAIAIETGKAPLRATASIGVASLDPRLRDANALLEGANAALAQAKREGRNRTVSWQDTNPPIQLPGRRVLKAGQIIFNGNLSTMDCTVRRLSDEGAGVEVSGTVGIPPRFDLAIKADKFLRACKVVGQSERHIDVEFV